MKTRSIKNERVKEKMFRNMISQGELAEILDIGQTEVSNMLKYELADAEQDAIIEKIDAWLEEKKGA